MTYLKKTQKDFLAPAIAEVTKLGGNYSFDTTRRHIKMTVRIGKIEKPFFAAATASDRRASMNFAKDVARNLRALLSQQ